MRVVKIIVAMLLNFLQKPALIRTRHDLAQVGGPRATLALPSASLCIEVIVTRDPGDYFPFFRYAKAF